MDTTRTGPLNHDESSRNEHQHVWTMLPWIANGSANAEQRAQAEAHLLHCADCRAELHAQQRLRRVLNEQAPAVTVDSQAGLQRLLGRLDAPLQEQPAPAAPAPRKRSPLLMAMAAAIFVQAVGLAVLGMHHAADEDFRTLSQGEAPSMAATLRVLPAPALTMAEWQALLQSHGLRVVSGPNTMGAYELAPVSAPAMPVADLVSRLREMPAIRFAEPISRER